MSRRATKNLNNLKQQGLPSGGLFFLEEKMAMTKNGISTTTAAGEEQYEIFTAGGKKRYWYDYRAEDGRLFSCVAKTLADCRAKRDAWLAKK